MESLSSTILNHDLVQGASKTAISALGALQRLPGASTAGALLLAWLVNRWYSDRVLNNGTTVKFDWKKEIVVVTGGSGGIGGEVVKKLAAKDITVVVIDVLPLTYPKRNNVHYYKCDLTKFEDLQSVAKRIRNEIGVPTVTLANAGICRGKPIIQASQRDIELTFGVNNLGLIWTAKTFLPSMIEKNHGHFLIIASQTAYTATPGLTDYSATKSAALAIYEGIDGEVRNIHKAHSVRITCISPGAVDTKMFTGIKMGPGMSALRPESLAHDIVEIIMAGRSRNVIIPGSAASAVWARVLPDWTRVATQGFATKFFTELKPHDPMKG